MHVTQISNSFDTNRDDTDDQKKADIGEVVALGEKVWVKVRHAPGNSAAELFCQRLPAASSSQKQLETASSN